MTVDTPTQVTPVSRRSISRPAGLAVVIVALSLLLGGAFIGADRLAHGYAERTIGTTLEGQLGLTTPPQVDIHGFPFLTQVLVRRYQRIDVVASDVTLGTAPALTVSSARLSLTDVTEDKSSYYVARLSGTAAMGWDQLAAVTGQRIAFDAATGRAAVTVRAAVLGTTVTVTLSGKPGLDVTGQRIVFGDGQIVIAGTSLPKAVADALISQFLQPVPLDLPYDIRATDLHLDDAGLGLDLGGQDVTIPR